MLQFFKKSAQTSGNDGRKSAISARRQSSTAKIDTILDESYANDVSETKESRSRLSKNLQEIISDKNCLSYFVQFLEMKNALCLIKFYLDAENFKMATKLCSSNNIISNSLSSLNMKPQQNESLHNNSNIAENVTVHHGLEEDDQSLSLYSLDTCNNRNSSSFENCPDTISFNSFDVDDRLSINSQSEFYSRDNIREDLENEAPEIIEEEKSVPELKTLCDLSMRKPLTDDEKSRICAETSKRTLYKKEKLTRAQSECKIDKAIDSIATDAIRIYKKYLTIHSPNFINIPATKLSDISLALCAQNDSGQSCFESIPSTIFEDAQRNVFEQLEKQYLNEFIQSTYYCKYNIDILTSETLTLSDILYGESALFYFMEYLEQEEKRDYLEFWMAATNFQKHYESCVDDNSFNKKEAQNDAMILYEKYFSLQASCPLRVSDSIRSSVEECICTEKDAVRKCFDLPIRIIENYLDEKYFSSFLASQLFSNYLNDLRSKVKDHKTPNWNSSSTRKKSHRKTLSDCTSENTKGIRNRFISQQNTLLAMESSKTKPSRVADMQIDSRLLNNPDLLWHRNSTGGLTFGRIDSFGRYERDFEMGTNTTEDKWSLLAGGGSKFKNVVRKLVNLPEDKVQEEIAWQMAEMIVKDITSITLNNNPESTQG